jgi:hypothetical protein
MDQIRTHPSFAALVVLTVTASIGLPAIWSHPAWAQTSGNTAGTSSFGRQNYIEYIAGNLPLIFSAPHGGTLLPAEVPDRTPGQCATSESFVAGPDWNTQPLARAILTAFFNRTGKYPHAIINRLHRQKLDANRTIAGGACGDPEARIAWNEYHQFIELAKARVLAEYGRGWYTDVHGHGHSVQRLELGYLLASTDLRLSNAVLDGTAAYEQKSAFATFSQSSPQSFTTLLRGTPALGTLLTTGGYRSVPSAQDPAPLSGDAYFNGGYNTATHGCATAGSICGVQIEHHFTGVRDTAANRATYAAALARAYDVFLAQNFGISLASTSGEIIADNDNGNNDGMKARFSPTLNWTAATGSPSHLNNYHVANGAGPPNDGAQFHFYVPSAGTYTVYAWWTSNSSRTTSASYRVYDRDGGTLLGDTRLNQQMNGGRWNVLGTWRFTRVGWAKVLMSRSLSAAGTICADAIRAVRQ